ncbi:MAG: glycosyltransferase [Acidobacteria bacterium]|nr:MAG: glycosyltransferase [Acidobacteriota bacterium]
MTEPSASPPVAVLIVTHDDAPDVPACLAAVAALRHRPLELVIVDCASGDGSAAVARQAAPPAVATTVVEADRNLGFAGGMNEALRRTDAPFVLSLNADARPAPDYVTRLLPHLLAPGRRVAAATGRLLRPPGGGPRLLDACGMRLVRSWRHLDRGSGEVDRGQYARPERVFGATGAATLLARAALDDVRFAPELHDGETEGAVFDPDFHSFREDAELCFRFQERGWQVVYEPAAVAEHRRTSLPERRRQLPPAINYHSLKNRYLLRLYHQTAGNLLRTLPATLSRDVLALGYVLLLERTSLPAYRWLWRNRRRILARRRWLAGRRLDPRAADRWLACDGLPLEPGPR